MNVNIRRFEILLAESKEDLKVIVKKAGVTYESIRNIRAKGRAKHDTVGKLAFALGTTVEYLTEV